MRLVLRRAVRAWGLLLALAAAALVATAAVTLIAGYDRQVTQAGWRTVAASAPPAERSLLITGSAVAAEYPARDAAVRAAFAGGLGGVPVSTAAARYGTGRQLLGDLPPVRMSADPVFAALASPADLSAHADLAAGSWPQPRREPVQVTLPQNVASILDVRTGSRIAMRDRATGRGSQVVVSGLWRPHDPQDPYWLLTPELGGAPATSYGPFVPAAEDFDRMVAGTTMVARWVVQPALATAGLAGIAAGRRALDPTVRNLPAQTGLGRSTVVTTGFDRLADRIATANAVGRSSMAIPLALVVILGLCVLIRVAALLEEDRRPQTELLRARGASRGQLAGLAAGEAALTVTWAAMLAPVAALLATSRLDPHPRADPTLWLVAGVVGAGCLLAMLGPATRPDPRAGGTRARRWAPAQRAGVDLLLVALAVLAWTQARQYSGAGSGPQVLPDPSLPAAPVLGVLAGAVLALRVLPPLTAYAQRWADRPRWPAATLGAWNAGRRTHTAQMLLLALAVGAGTLASSLLATVDRSHAAQAAHEVGADLRLRDTGGSAERAAQLAALPGVRTVTPAWRDDIRIGSDDVPATVIATAGVGGPAVRSGVALPPDAVRLSGVVGAGGARVTALVSDANGLITRSALPHAGPFSVALPAGPLRLAGVDTDARAIALTALHVIRPDGSAAPVDLRGAGWSVLSGRARATVTPAAAGELRAKIAGDDPAHLTVVAQPTDRPVPAVVTPDILYALDAKVSDTVPLALPDADLTIQVIGVRPALPGVTAPAAILLDLPAAADRALFATGTVRPYPEWRIATEPARHAGAAAAAAALPGISVVDRVAVERAADRDPYWLGVRTGLLATVLSAVVLALVGYGVDMGIGLRRRAADDAVLRRLGAGSALLARAFLVEQSLVAGAGAIAGLAVGVLVSTLTVPLAVLTPAAARPVPAPAPVLPCGPIAALAAGLPAAILLLSWAITLRRRS